MSQAVATVTGEPQQQNIETQREITETLQNGDHLVSIVNEDQPPSVQEERCILKQDIEIERNITSSDLQSSTPKSPAVQATEDFLIQEKVAYTFDGVDHSESLKTVESSEEDKPLLLISVAPVVEPQTPAHSEASELECIIVNNEDPKEVSPHEVDVSEYTETIPVAEATELNGHHIEDKILEPEVEVLVPVTNGYSEDRFKSKNITEPEEVISNDQFNNKAQVLNGTIATELVIEDYKLPDVVEVKKQFENVKHVEQNSAQSPPKKGALSTSLDSQSIKQAYQDVRHDASDTQWAVFKFEGPTITTSSTGSDFNEFKEQFGQDDRAFAYIRVQTGDELSRRAKFLLVTWVGPSVSVLKRAKMSTDKALIKDIISNFAVEIQTENISDINLQNFETVLDKAAGAHYGTGIRS